MLAPSVRSCITVEQRTRSRGAAASTVPFTQDRHGDARTLELKELVSDLSCDGQTLAFTLRTDVATARPDELISKLLGVPVEKARTSRVRLVQGVRKLAVTA